MSSCLARFDVITRGRRIRRGLNDSIRFRVFTNSGASVCARHSKEEFKLWRVMGQLETPRRCRLLTRQARRVRSADAESDTATSETRSECATLRHSRAWTSATLLLVDELPQTVGTLWTRSAGVAP